MLSSAARRLVGRYGVKPGTRAVVATDTDRGYEAVLDLIDVGMTVAAVIDTRSADLMSEMAQAVRNEGVLVLTDHRIVRAVGKGRVKAVIVAPTADEDRIQRIH